MGQLSQARYFSGEPQAHLVMPCCCDAVIVIENNFIMQYNGSVIIFINVLESFMFTKAAFIA